MNTPTNQPRHALLLVGSAKKEHESTSEALGHYLLEQLAAQGFSSETIHVQRALRTPDRTSELLKQTSLFPQPGLPREHS